MKQLKESIYVFVSDHILFFILLCMWGIIGLLFSMISYNDNPIEQLAEKEIEKLTGIEIDFSKDIKQGTE